MLARLLVRPDHATIAVDERAELTVSVQAECGQAFPMPTVEWSANGGTVMAESVFSAEETRKTPYSRLAYARGLGGMDSGVLRVRRRLFISWKLKTCLATVFDSLPVSISVQRRQVSHDRSSRLASKGRKFSPRFVGQLVQRRQSMIVGHPDFCQHGMAKLLYSCQPIRHCGISWPDQVKVLVSMIISASHRR